MRVSNDVDSERSVYENLVQEGATPTSFKGFSIGTIFTQLFTKYTNCIFVIYFYQFK